MVLANRLVLDWPDVYAKSFKRLHIHPTLPRISKMMACVVIDSCPESENKLSHCCCCSEFGVYVTMSNKKEQKTHLNKESTVSFDPSVNLFTSLL